MFFGKVLISCGLLLFAPLWGQRLGLPQIQNYDNTLFKRSFQTWTGLQDGRGVVYFGCQGGIAAFDGLKWDMITTPAVHIRAIASSQDGAIYWGGVGNFGYLAAGPSNSVTAVSLLDKLPGSQRELEDIWQAGATKDGVYLFTARKIIRIEPGKVEMLDCVSGQIPPAVMNDVMFFIDATGTVCAMTGSKITPLRFGPKNARILSPLGGHRMLMGHFGPEKTGGKLEMAVYDLSSLWTGKGYDFASGRPLPACVPFAEGFLEKMQKSERLIILRARPLSGDRIALSAYKQGLLILDSKGQLISRYDDTTGVVENIVNDFFEDANHHLWLATNSGVSYVLDGSPFRYLGKKNGMDGIITCFAFFKGHYYFGTFTDVYRAEPVDLFKHGSQTMKAINEVTAEAWQFLEVGDQLLLANGSGGMSVVREDGVRQISARPYFSYCLANPKKFKNYVFSAGMGPMLCYQKVPVSKEHRQGWRLLGPVKGVGGNIRCFAEDVAGDLWVYVEAKGAGRLRFNSASPLEASIEYLPKDNDTWPFGWVYAHQDRLYVACRKGFLRAHIPPGNRRDLKDLKFELETTFGQPLIEPPTLGDHLGFQAPSTVWVGHGEGFYRADNLAGGGVRIEKNLFREIPPPDAAFYITPDQQILLPGKPAQVIDTRRFPIRHAPFKTLIRQVRANDKTLFSGVFNGKNPMDLGSRQLEKIELPFKNNSLEFNFTAVFHEKHEGNAFEHLLEGKDATWSDWSLQTTKEYMNLREGQYVFKVRSRNFFGELGEEAVFSFKILPPWYRTWWAWAIWTLLFGLGILGCAQLYTLRLRRQKAYLEHLVAKRTEEYLAAKERAEQASAFKSIFIANTSHELRTPLNAILGFMRILAGGAVGKHDTARFIKIVLNAGESLLQIVNDLLDLSKIEAGKLEVDCQPFQIREVIENVMAILGHRANEKQLALTAVVDAGVPTLLLGDGHRVQQMMINLLGNSLKFTRKGHVSLKVSGKGVDGTWEITVEVEDTGPGVPPATLSKLFTAFTQADSDAKKLGTGLGLSITRQLAELMGGSVGASSQLGEGSLFWFVIQARAAESGPHQPLRGKTVRLLVKDGPVRRQLEQALPALGASITDLSTAEEWVSDEPAKLPPGPGLVLMKDPFQAEWPEGVRGLSQPFGELGLARAFEAGSPAGAAPERKERPGRSLIGKVLMADDNPSNRLLMEALLRQIGLTYDTVEDGREALDQFTKDAYDVVILDGHMPQMDGMETLQALRQLPKGQQVPVVLFSASLTKQNLESALSGGFDGVLKKPVELEDLETVLSQWLRWGEERLPEEELQGRGSSAGRPEISNAAHLLGLERALGGLEELKEFIGVFFEDSPQRMEKIKKGLLTQEVELITREAHDLKSNAANLGLEALSALAQRLEREAMTAGVEQVREWAMELEKALSEGMQALETWVRARDKKN